MNAILNPFQNETKAAAPLNTALIETESERAIAEVQAVMVIARRFPRDEVSAMDKILQSCARQGLAETAMYTYSRGGSNVTGPSIRLAEALAVCWGNIQFGWKEIERGGGESTVEAFSWDVERNVRQTKTFHVPHKRVTKRGVTILSDPRDISELVANFAARRVRSCILGIIPGDIVETAVNQCELTLHTHGQVTPERLAKMVEVFSEYGVTTQQIEKRIGRRLDAMTPALLLQLGKIANSLKDGMSSPADWFESEKPQEATDTTMHQTVVERVAEKIRASKQAELEADEGKS